MSPLRETVYKTMSMYRDILNPDNKGWKCLEVGTDGDEKPSGNFPSFGKGNDWKTMDFLPQLHPDYVCDLCDTGLPSESFDLIIVSQDIEHIFDYFKALQECERLLKQGGHLIVDCPWQYPYHATQDYGDYWRISNTALRKLLLHVGLRPITCEIYNDILTSALCQK